MSKRLDFLLEKIQQIKEENKALKEEIKELKNRDKAPSLKVNKKEKRENVSLLELHVLLFVSLAYAYSLPSFQPQPVYQKQRPHSAAYSTNYPIFWISLMHQQFHHF